MTFGVICAVECLVGCASTGTYWNVVFNLLIVRSIVRRAFPNAHCGLRIYIGKRV